MHTALEVIGWSFVAAVTTWGITLYWAKLAFASTRATLHQEIRYWHDEAHRARELAAQLRQEVAAWSRGCQQGREDVMAVMPLLVAQEGRSAGARAAEVVNAEI